MIGRGFVWSIILVGLLLRPEVLLAQQPVVTPMPATVIVEWTTESEVNLAGFNLYRSENADGPYVKVNDTLIPASTDPVTGGSYAYTDTEVTPGIRYYYKLEDVELDGSSTMHGPIELVAQADTGQQGFQVSTILAVSLAAALMVTAAFAVARRRKRRSPLARSSSVDPGD